MDIRITVQASEPETRKLIRQYYALYYRVARFYWIDLALVLGLAFFHPDQGVKSAIPGGFLLLFYLWGLPWIGFRSTWKNFLGIWRTTKIFECPTHYRFTDEFLEVERNGSVSKQQWSDSVSAFYFRRDTLMLFCGKAFFAAFTRSAFPRSEEFDAVVTLFRQGNYQDHSKFPVKQALIPWSIGAALLLFGYFWKMAG